MSAVIAEGGPTLVGPYWIWLCADGESPDPDDLRGVTRVSRSDEPHPKIDSPRPGVLDLRAPQNMADAQLDSAVFLAVLAAEHSDLCLIAELDRTDATCVLAVPTGEHDLEGARPVLVRGTVAYDGDWSPISRIDLVRADGSRCDISTLPREEQLDALAGAGLAAAERYDLPTAAGLAAPVRSTVLASQAEALGTLVASLPMPATIPSVVESAFEPLRDIQQMCLSLYGRLEPARALAWALEELGELAQAMRRGESSARLEEELGQVLAWGFCLANIARVDVANAFTKAFEEERARQVRKWGEIHPYRRAVDPR